MLQFMKLFFVKIYFLFSENSLTHYNSLGAGVDSRG